MKLKIEKIYIIKEISCKPSQISSVPNYITFKLLFKIIPSESSISKLIPF